MPQLDPSSYVSQTFWLILTFVSLFLIINFFFIPKIEKIRMLRENKVENLIENAERISAEANSLKIKTENELQSAKTKIDKNINELIKKNSELVEKKIKKIDIDIEKFIDDVSKYSFEISNLIYYKIVNEKNEISSNEFKKLMVEDK